MLFMYLFAYLGVAYAKEVYGKIDVSYPVLIGGQVTFKITLQRTCQQYGNWQLTFQGTRQMFYNGKETTIMKVNTTYILTLKNATSTYHRSDILFLCDGKMVDIVTLDLVGKWIS